MWGHACPWSSKATSNGLKNDEKWRRSAEIDRTIRALVYIKINDAKSIENAKKNSLCHFFGGQQKYLQEDRRLTEKSLYWKKNSGISNWKNVKIEKTREIKYFINFTKFCFSYKKLTEKKHFIILQYQNSNPHWCHSLTNRGRGIYYRNEIQLNF